MVWQLHEAKQKFSRGGATGARRRAASGDPAIETARPNGQPLSFPLVTHRPLGTRARTASNEAWFLVAWVPIESPHPLC